MLDWELWGSVFYVVSSIGYVLADFTVAAEIEISNAQYAIVYIVLALVFQVDSILYLLSWWYYELDEIREHGFSKRRFWGGYTAEALNILGSAFFVGSASLAFFGPSFAPANNIITLLACIVFLADAIAYMVNWHLETEPGDHLRLIFRGDPECWAYMVELAASVVYMGSSGTAVALSRVRHAHFRYPLTQGIASFGDLLYLVASCLWCVAWYRDKQKERAKARLDAATAATAAAAAAAGVPLAAPPDAVAVAVVAGNPATPADSPSAAGARGDEQRRRERRRARKTRRDPSLFGDRPAPATAAAIGETAAFLFTASSAAAGAAAAAAAGGAVLDRPDSPSPDERTPMLRWAGGPLGSIQR